MKDTEGNWVSPEQDFCIQYLADTFAGDVLWRIKKEAEIDKVSRTGTAQYVINEWDYVQGRIKEFIIDDYELQGCSGKNLTYDMKGNII